MPTPSSHLADLGVVLEQMLAYPECPEKVRALHHAMRLCGLVSPTPYGALAGMAWRVFGPVTGAELAFDALETQAPTAINAAMQPHLEMN